MQNKQATAPDGADAGPESTALRVALWRALHVQVDAPPHVIDDEIGLRLAAPADGWQQRPDMHPLHTSLFRASIVARARFVEDLVLEELGRGVGQYVILGAGLDTFAQRRPELAPRLKVFEVDQPKPQAWKRRRLSELGLTAPDWPRFVPVDFEAGEGWRDRLLDAGFDADRPAVVSSTGVSMYLSKVAIGATLRQVAGLAKGSTYVMSFLVPLELADPEVRVGFEQSAKGARAGGTPWLSFFAPQEMVAMARYAGFAEARHVASGDLGARYFADRADGLHPPTCGEELLVATT